MTYVAEILDRIAPDRPVEERWDEIVLAAGTQQHDRRRRRRLVAAIALATAAAVVGSAAALRQVVFVSSPRSGTFVERSGGLELRGEVGACGAAVYIYSHGDFQASAAGMPVRGVPRCRPPAEIHSVGFLGGSTGNGRFFVAGLTAPNVRRLVVIPLHGRPFPVKLVRAPSRLASRVSFYLATYEYTPPRRSLSIRARSGIRSLVTYDAGGRLLERWRLPGSPRRTPRRR